MANACAGSKECFSCLFIEITKIGSVLDRNCCPWDKGGKYLFSGTVFKSLSLYRGRVRGQSSIIVVPSCVFFSTITFCCLAFYFCCQGIMQNTPSSRANVKSRCTERNRFNQDSQFSIIYYANSFLILLRLSPVINTQALLVKCMLLSVLQPNPSCDNLAVSWPWIFWQSFGARFPHLWLGMWWIFWGMPPLDNGWMLGHSQVSSSL